MNKSFFFIVSASLLLFAGCIIVPIPLFETQCHSLWSGRVTGGREMNIAAMVRTWYMPIVASAEGPAKDRSMESQYTYFAEEGKSSYREDHVPDKRAIWLPWLDQKTDSSGNWDHCERMEGTPFWCIQRVVYWGDKTESGASVYPRFLQIEYAVFDLQALKSKKILHVEMTTDKILDQYDDKTLVIEYKSPAGWRRYRLLDAVEEEISQPDWAAAPSASPARPQIRG